MTSHFTIFYGTVLLSYFAVTLVFAQSPFIAFSSLIPIKET